MKYLTVKEVAEKWKVTTRRVRQLIEEGRVKGARKETVRGIAEHRIPAGATKPKPLPLIRR